MIALKTPSRLAAVCDFGMFLAITAVYVIQCKPFIVYISNGNPVVAIGGKIGMNQSTRIHVTDFSGFTQAFVVCRAVVFHFVVGFTRVLRRRDSYYESSCPQGVRLSN